MYQQEGSDRLQTRAKTIFMLLEESLWIKSCLEGLPLSSGQVCLNIASSTLKYRTKDQPYIEEHVFGPIYRRGLKILHLDEKQDEGIDLCLNINHKDFPSKYHAPKAHIVLCTSLLEHINDIPQVLSHLRWVTRQNGYILLSVPRFFGYHPDPIDTMYRPTPKQLSSLLKPYGFTTIASHLLHSSSWPTYLGDVLAGYLPMRFYPKHLSARRLRRLTLNIKLPSRVALVVLRKDREC